MCRAQTVRTHHINYVEENVPGNKCGYELDGIRHEFTTDWAKVNCPGCKRYSPETRAKLERKYK